MEICFVKPDEETSSIRSYYERDNITDDLTHKRQKSKHWHENNTQTPVVSKMTSFFSKSPTSEPNPSNSPSLRDIYKSILTVPQKSVGKSKNNTIIDLSLVQNQMLNIFIVLFFFSELSLSCILILSHLCRKSLTVTSLFIERPQSKLRVVLVTLLYNSKWYREELWLSHSSSYSE